MKTHVTTFTGKKFDFANPKPEQVCIEDIAHHLARVCRYAGGVTEFYSVAQHCVICTEIAPDNCKLHALLHDAAETYTCDLTGPAKQQVRGYKEMENRIEPVIWKALGVEDMPRYHEEVKLCDNRVLVTEQRDLFLVKRAPSFNLPPLDRHIHPLGIREAERCFLNMYRILTGRQVRA